MGYEKPSTKLTFYKAFFSAQWKFLIHTLLQCMSAKRTSWNEFSSSMASAVICLSTGRKFIFFKYIFDSLVRNVDSSSKFYMYPRFLQLMIRAQVGDLSSHTTKYSSYALTQKVFANMRKVGKGFFGVETPLFEGILVPQQAAVDVDDVVADSVPIDDVAADVPVAIAKPTPPSPPHTTPPQDLPSTSQVVPTPPPTPIAQPSSPPQQQQPSQPTTISMDLLNNLLETCTALTRRVENLEQDKITQALEILKLKKRVRKLEKNKKLKATGGIIANIDVDKDVTLEEVEVEKTTEVEKDADVQGRLEESQAKVYHIDLEHADKVLSMQDDEPEPAELQEVIEVVTTAKLMTEVVTAATTTITAAAPITVAIITDVPSAARRRKGAIIRDPVETGAPSIIIHSEPKSKDKGKRIMVEEPKTLKKQAQIEQDEAYARKYQTLKKSQTEAQARKNMMVYLKNMAGFKIDYFKGISYDNIRPIFEKYFNSNVAFLEKSKEHLEEEESRALKRQSESLEEKAATPLARNVFVVDYEIHSENNKPSYKIIRADGSHQLFLSFLSLLRNFDREDLEVLWKLVQKIFASSKPKNFSDNFLLTTLTYMFKKPDVEAQVWKNQRNNLAGREKICINKVYFVSDDEQSKNDKSSIDEPPEVELKDLPPHLEYVFLEGDDKLPVIIAKDLSVEEKAALIKVLKLHKQAIAWKLSDIKGINPEFCTHKILIDDDFEPAVQHQRRVNPRIHKVIKKEVLKLLDAGLIYPISDSPWVSPVHCVPKKDGFTVVENEENELIPTRLVTGWRVCIDYCKLNEATRKDHFPLPFMDQMLERLAGNEYYCFLDARPMTRLLEKDTSFFFSNECIEAFQTLEKKLTEAPVLVAPDWDLPFELMCDASDFAIGSFPSSRGNKYILVAIDYLSKWVEAKPLPTNDARVVCKFLKSLFARFGTPCAIISDRGTHFCNDQFAKVMLKYGVTHRLATAYHPQTSGHVEVSNRGLKRILERIVGENRAS
nr:reverse transcriptase domain-containing protein [Tanacetum cinerariifolium]